MLQECNQTSPRLRDLPSRHNQGKDHSIYSTFIFTRKSHEKGSGGLKTFSYPLEDLSSSPGSRTSDDAISQCSDVAVDSSKSFRRLVCRNRPKKLLERLFMVSTGKFRPQFDRMGSTTSEHLPSSKHNQHFELFLLPVAY